MNIKNNLNLIRGILYLNEIIRLKSINRAAEENNIKASNLSMLLKNLEKQLDVKLIIRSPRGCAPTAQGLQIAQYALAIDEQLANLQLWRQQKCACDKMLNIFVAANLTLYDYSDFTTKHPHIKLNFVDDELLADVKISNLPPLNNKISCTQLTIGNDIKQKIWVSCNEQNHNAMEFFDFIIAKLLDEYAQSTR